MSKLDELFRKRLERIRQELNSYIDSRLSIAEQKLSSETSEGVAKEKKKSGVQERFLNYMKLCAEDEEEFEDDDFDEEEDKCSGSFQQEIESKQSGKWESPQIFSRHTSQRPDFSVSNRYLEIPNFLKNDGKHAEIDEFLSKKEESFSEMLLRLIDEKGLKDSDVYKNANIDRRLFSKIRGDKDYVPSKKTAISFCLALELDVDEAKKLLETAGYTLSSSSRFDLIIMYLIETKEYNIHFVNIVLDDYGEGTLSR